MKPIVQTATTSYVHKSTVPLTWIFSSLVCLCLCTRVLKNPISSRQILFAQNILTCNILTITITMQRDCNNKKIHKIEYVIIQCHVNFNLYEISQTAVYFKCVLPSYFKNSYTHA
jgi:hypothetical protein